MKKDSNNLLDYRKNYTSQFGEDGIIEKIIDVLPNEKVRWCVEFGAWDGIFCSNTNKLITRDNFNAVLIEGDAQKVEELKNTFRDYSENVFIKHKWIDFEENSIDRILNGTPIPKDFTLISLDIDGEDFHIWKSISVYKPKIVVIEFNPTIPMHIDIVQERGTGNNFGASALALQNLGKEKGYELISMTDNNMIFVDEKYYKLFNLMDNSCTTLFAPFEKKYMTQMYQKYTGEWVVCGNRKLFWYGVNMSIRDKDVQIVPKWLQFFFASTPRFLRIVAKAYMRLFKSKNFTNVVND